jgi:hypothetical protein
MHAGSPDPAAGVRSHQRPIDTNDCQQENENFSAFLTQG